jgi:hypothetical protein
MRREWLKPLERRRFALVEVDAPSKRKRRFFLYAVTAGVSFREGRRQSVGRKRGAAYNAQRRPNEYLREVAQAGAAERAVGKRAFAERADRGEDYVEESA